MKETSHQLLSLFVFEQLKTVLGKFPLYDKRSDIAKGSMAVDWQQDLELVEVSGRLDSNPHNDENDDNTTVNLTGQFAKMLGTNNFWTTFNHFIDIRKGPGIYDDFDGYSFDRGSAKGNQYETLGHKLQDAGKAADSVSNMFEQFHGKDFRSMPVDRAIMAYLGDHYVHAPGFNGYRDCSSSIERYSFHQDKGEYDSVEEESRSRFIRDYNGVPASVFMPLDNMARYWYLKFRQRRDPQAVGFILHALQDASIPHHAAGCSGNWHASYEEQLAKNIVIWQRNGQLVQEVQSYYNQFEGVDEVPPTSLAIDDWNKVPKSNWAIEWMVTWMALNAYQSYREVYNNFETGFDENKRNMLDLTAKSTALCMHLIKNLTFNINTKRFNSQDLRVVTAANNRWALVYRIQTVLASIASFSSQSNAELAKRVIGHYDIDQVCATTSNFKYYLSHGKGPGVAVSPRGLVSNIPPLPEERSIDIDGDTLEITENSRGHYVIKDQNYEFFDFGRNDFEAHLALSKMMEYGFSEYHWIGDYSDPELIYMLTRVPEAVPNPI